MNSDKTKTASIALILMLTFSATILAIPIVSAHDPPWTIQNWAYVAVVPETIGVNQEMLIVFWPAQYPLTAQGKYGDRWTWHVEITKPDGSKDNFGPFTSDPVGSSWMLYTPTQLGTYSVVSIVDEHVLTGLPDITPSVIRSPEYVGDKVTGATSDPVQFVVQQDPIEKYQETPLPTDYWTRPIYGANRDWWKVAGNWLGGAHLPDDINPYSTGPESAHIMWTRPYWEGGIMDGMFGSIGYYTGMSYERFTRIQPFVINGRLFYNQQTPPRYGWYCVDLYTGETLYFRNTTGPAADMSGTGSFDYSGGLPVGELAFGQIYNYDSPNQHGGFPYLWSTVGEGEQTSSYGSTTDTWMLFDAFTGNYICSIANVSTRGTLVYGRDGSILRFDIRNGRLTCWNTSYAIWYEDFYSSNEYWMWRPDFNYTFDGNNGFSIDVAIPDLDGDIQVIRDGEYLIGGHGGKKNSTFTEQGTLWALSLEPGKEGQLLWQINFTPPQTVDDASIVRRPGYRDVQFSRVDPDNEVFFFEQCITRTRWCYSLKTGQLLWGPSDPEPQFNFYDMDDFVYNGRLYSHGYSGTLTAYDIATGNVDWTWSAPDEGLGETFYQRSPLDFGCIADGKVYMYSTEHSPTMPLRRDSNIWCVDLETGQLVWKIQCWANDMLIADGYLVTLDSFDNQFYCYGKGPSETTVQGPDRSILLGEEVLLTGTVTDQTPSGRHSTTGSLEFSLKGTPAIADEDQEAWMEYMFQQRPMPMNTKGVEVKLEVLDPNMNFYEIGRTTSDASGFYSLLWEPPVPGKYTVIATFEGSKSYYSSFGETAFAVGEALSPSGAIEPEPTEPAETPLVTTEIAIVIAAVIVAVAVLAGFWVIRKRK